MTTTVHTHIADLSSDQKAALAAALRARVTAPSPQQNAENEAPGYDVLILGGGPAGLTLALQLHTESPGTKIAVIERLTHPVSETTHKVGESTVEIAAHYLRDVLGLQDHLERDQLRKFGLRMFFSTDDNTDIADRVELGSSVFPPLCTYQLDRGRLENELGRRCLDAGIKFLDGTKIIDVEFDHPLHRALVDGPDGEQQITARWVVDASGRSQLLHRFDQGQRTAVGHSASAAWFRIAHPVDVNTWSDKTDWVTRTFEGDRALSTNHLMGDGYWVWLIRLATGSTSIGIVADSHTHPFNSYNTLEKARGWLRAREPQCAAVVEQHLDAVQDFRVMRNYSFGCDMVFSGERRWCLTGESGVFLDPLYSPGLDLIAIGNTLTTDLIVRSLNGEDVTALAVAHDNLFRSVASIWLAIYEKQYQLMGNAKVMSSKVIWDTGFYWGVFGLLFFQNKFTKAASMASVVTNLGKLTVISNRMQAFFREWKAIDDTPLNPGFIDLYSPLDFMVALHAGMADQLTDAEFEKRFSDNTRLFTQLAGQLVSAVLSTYAERTDDNTVAAVQRWQRDPVITDMLATYRRERRRNPTSDQRIATNRNPDRELLPQPVG